MDTALFQKEKKFLPYPSRPHTTKITTKYIYIYLYIFFHFILSSFTFPLQLLLASWLIISTFIQSLLSSISLPSSSPNHSLFYFVFIIHLLIWFVPIVISRNFVTFICFVARNFYTWFIDLWYYEVEGKTVLNEEDEIKFEKKSKK